MSDNAKEELKSAEELHRFETGIMLGQTAVYLVATGGLLGVCKDNIQFITISISIFGFLLSLAFLFIAKRTGENLRGARRRAEELGEKLGFKLYSPYYRADSNSVFSGKNITKFICIIGGVLWIVVFFMAIFAN